VHDDVLMQIMTVDCAPRATGSVLSEYKVLVMVTPYDWQEGIRHRASYVQQRLAGGSPAIAISHEKGVLMVTIRRRARKIFEIYDRLALATVGQQSDVESLRVAAIDFAHQEGFQRSEADVTIQRIVMAMSQPLKRSFGDFNTAPFVARALFAEVGDEPAEDKYYILDYDGDFSLRERWAVLLGEGDLTPSVRERLDTIQKSKQTLDAAIEALEGVWGMLVSPDGKGNVRSNAGDLQIEAAILYRSGEREQRFFDLR